MALGHALLCAGALDRSRTLLVEAAAGFLELDPAGFRQLCLALLAHASALLGEPTEAENALEEAERVQRPGIHVFDPMLGLARVWAEAAAGATSSARAHAYDLAEQTATNGQGAFAAVALHDLARLGEPRPAAPRLALLVRRLDGPLPAAYAEHAGALAAGDARHSTEPPAASKQAELSCWPPKPPPRRARLTAYKGKPPAPHARPRDRTFSPRSARARAPGPRARRRCRRPHPTGT